jgi:hypothetical protein
MSWQDNVVGLNDACLDTFGEPVVFIVADTDVIATAAFSDDYASVRIADQQGQGRLIALELPDASVPTGVAERAMVKVRDVQYEISEMWSEAGMTTMLLSRYRL